MEVVEDIEERILGTLSHEVLNVVNYKHIHLHIECKEVSQFVPDVDSIHILSLESVGRNV